jgi:hypothetical protein
VVARFCDLVGNIVDGDDAIEEDNGDKNQKREREVVQEWITDHGRLRGPMHLWLARRRSGFDKYQETQQPAAPSAVPELDGKQKIDINQRKRKATSQRWRPLLRHATAVAKVVGSRSDEKT